MWETIDAHTDRLKVPGGWIVRSSLIKMEFHDHFVSVATSVHQIFIPDFDHMWILERTT